jgi:hypothetical protein
MQRMLRVILALFPELNQMLCSRKIHLLAVESKTSVALELEPSRSREFYQKGMIWPPIYLFFSDIFKATFVQNMYAHAVSCVHASSRLIRSQLASQVSLKNEPPDRQFI